MPDDCGDDYVWPSLVCCVRYARHHLQVVSTTLSLSFSLSLSRTQADVVYCMYDAIGVDRRAQACGRLLVDSSLLVERLPSSGHTVFGDQRALNTDEVQQQFI